MLGTGFENRTNGIFVYTVARKPSPHFSGVFRYSRKSTVVPFCPRDVNTHAGSNVEAPKHTSYSDRVPKYSVFSVGAPKCVTDNARNVCLLAILPCIRYTLGTTVQICPEENTRLSGLYTSGGMFCSQCEAEGFRRITFAQDRPDVMSTFSVSAVPSVCYGDGYGAHRYGPKQCDYHDTI